jgi:glucan 1,3-beta-glucosidase
MAESAQSHTVDVNTTISSDLKAASLANRRNLVVDEWSCALTARSLSQESDPASAQRDFCTGQMNVYADAAAGWSFWSYNKEDCETDGGWCFRKAVGQFLPQTFFSYPHPASNGAPPSAPRNPLAAGLNDPTAQLLGNLNDPPISEIVSMAYSKSTDVNGTDDSVSTTTPSPTPTATVMTSSSIATPDATASVQQQRRAWTSGGAHHRKHSQGRSISGTHGAQRRDDIFDPSKNPDAPYNPLAHMSPSQVAIARGYQDGFQTAKTFAQYGMSKLGFTGQYISDTVSELVAAGNIAKNEQTTYGTWFMKGLRDAEAEIAAAASNTPVVYPGASPE